MSVEEPQLHKTLKGRHINMIAIGGAIGTGVFLAMGVSISQGGPGGALLSYAVIGVAVYFMMNSLGEMSTYAPGSGNFQVYSTRYVDKSFGFMMGWNYVYYVSTTLAAEAVATAILMHFWLPNVPGWIWSAATLVLILILNIFSALAYAEGEFWFAGIKVVTIVIFLVIGVMMIFGILHGPSPGFSNWTEGAAPFVNGAAGTFTVMLAAAFSYSGIEAVTITSGETTNTDKLIPQAIRTVFWRILLFYLGTIVVIGFLLPYTDPNLLASDVDNIAVSPFTLILQKAGIAFAASFMNAVILTSLLSCSNSNLYQGSRLLYSMGKGGQAPKIFGKVSKHGVPVPAVILILAIASLAFLASVWSESVVYVILIDATSMACLIAWFGIALAHIRFRRACKVQGVDPNQFKFKAKFYPWGAYISAIISIAVIVGQVYFFVGKAGIQWGQMALMFSGIPLVLILFVVYKLVKKTKLIPLDEMDLSHTAALGE
ncbi:MAG: amino acid permease [Propionibacteriaceae bacterium]|nr:amino acid permease [Propionibacteriaceae bacterium]